MNSSALVMWITTVLVAGGFCGYFFFRVMTAKKRPEPDSYSGNDND
jgi:hypothetical protein